MKHDLWTYARNYALRMGFRNDAEDFAQEVMLKVHTSRRSSVENLFVDYIRSKYGRFKNKRTAKMLEAMSYDPFDERTHGKVEEGNTIVVMFAETMNGGDKAIFVLRYLWGFTEKEIAYAFGLTENAICHRLRALRTRLKKGADDAESEK